MIRAAATITTAARCSPQNAVNMDYLFELRQRKTLSNWFALLISSIKRSSSFRILAAAKLANPVEMARERSLFSSVRGRSRLQGVPK